MEKRKLLVLCHDAIPPQLLVTCRSHSMCSIRRACERGKRSMTLQVIDICTWNYVNVLKQAGDYTSPHLPAWGACQITSPIHIVRKHP